VCTKNVSQKTSSGISSILLALRCFFSKRAQKVPYATSYPPHCTLSCAEKRTFSHTPNTELYRGTENSLLFHASMPSIFRQEGGPRKSFTKSVSGYFSQSFVSVLLRVFPDEKPENIVTPPPPQRFTPASAFGEVRRVRVYSYSLSCFLMLPVSHQYIFFVVGSFFLRRL